MTTPQKDTYRAGMSTDRADDLAAARGCSYENECWSECADAAQAALDEGLNEHDLRLLAAAAKGDS